MIVNPRTLAPAALVLFVTLGAGCGTAYTLEPRNPPGMLTEDQSAVTLAKGDVSVTVGQLYPVDGAQVMIGVLVRNDSDRELAVRVQDARVLVNGEPVALFDQPWYDKQKRLAGWAGALGAASSSLARSNALNAQDPYAGTTSERRGDVAKTALSQQMGRTLAAQQLFQASLDADRAMSEELGQAYAAELAKASSVAWSDTYELRAAMKFSVPLMDEYRWRDEAVPPRSWLFRGLFADPDSAGPLLGGQGGRVEVEIELGGERFEYAFDAVVLRSLSERTAAIKDNRARAMAVRQK